MLDTERPSKLTMAARRAVPSQSLGVDLPTETSALDEEADRDERSLGVGVACRSVGVESRERGVDSREMGVDSQSAPASSLICGGKVRDRVHFLKNLYLFEYCL